MTDTAQNTPTQKALKPTIVVIILVVALLLGLGWVMTKGQKDNRYNQPGTNGSQTQQTNYPIPTEPTNPNVTGGTSGAGTGNNNDPSVGTPSPAGGVDTNQVPATGQ